MQKKDMKKITRNLIMSMAVLSGLYTIMQTIAKRELMTEELDEENPYLILQEDSSEGYGDTISKPGFYEKYVKSAIDRMLAFGGLILLSPIFALISLAVYIDDPGPVFFTQKRVGKGKHFFILHKFRSMKMSAPHDVPTHQFSNPEQYITKVGKFLRKTSLDELPQIWDIFCGKMSIIGPRPALWNQKDLVEQRDLYEANSVLPGLTGLAQIKGRDELEIEDKAKLDGEYVRILRQGGGKALFFDMKCFFSTIKSVANSDGIVEGGVGNIDRTDSVNTADVGFEEYGYKKIFYVDKSIKKRVLITGAHSYVGESFERWAKVHYPILTIDVLDMTKDTWRNYDFSSYDVVFHVAGIAHADSGKIDEITEKKYYKVNTDLAIETAKIAKSAGVMQFILMSSMIVYGESAHYGKIKVIDEYTIPSPQNVYGDSKWRADKEIRELGSDGFKVAVLRAPMIYGQGSKGNYPLLANLAKKLPIFPDVNNNRSMLYY